MGREEWGVVGGKSQFMVMESEQWVVMGGKSGWCGDRGNSGW